MSAPCLHARVVAEVVDQTLGVMCADCGESLGVCWQDEHCSEANWNRAAAQDPENCKPCKQNRDDFCFLCGEQFTVGATS